MKKLSLAVFVLLAPLTSVAEVYEIDGTHSKVGFKVKHLGISNVIGNFNEFSGEFKFDPENIDKSSVEAKIVTKSIDTDVEKRDKHLVGEDFFDAPKFPLLSFKSSGIKDVSGKDFKILGTLTLHGVSKEVELETTYNGSVKDPWGKNRSAFVAKTKIDRRDYGLTWSKLLETGGLVVDNDVYIELEIEGVKKEASGEKEKK